MIAGGGCHVHDWHRLASIDQGPCSGELLHTCSICAAHPLVYLGVVAQEQEDPMVILLHSCTLACKANPTTTCEKAALSIPTC